jgi:glycosyltransferase involved in cell wall biosynthesis
VSAQGHAVAASNRAPTTGRDLPPQVTVVVPTRDRPESLSRCLEAILQQQTDRVFEIVLVDDGREHPVAAPFDDRVRVVPGPRRGPAAARNRGIAAAEGEILLFTDDDALVQPDWLQAAVEALESHPEALGVEGPVTCPLFDRLYEHAVVSERPGGFVTCNVGYRADALRRVGGFDERFRFAYHEDVDLAATIVRLGEIRFVDEMRVVHPPRPAPLREMVERGRLIESEWLFHRKHPEARARWWPVRWGPLLGILRRWKLILAEEQEPRRNWSRRARAVALAGGELSVALFVALTRWRSFNRETGLIAPTPTTDDPRLAESVVREVIPEDARTIALDVTACVPTGERTDDLVLTVKTLLEGSVAPATVLVSSYDPDAEARREIEAGLKRAAPRRPEAVLLEPPLCGNRSGNRNWLAAHVETPFLLFMDDDVDIHPRFVEHALDALRSGSADIVVAASRGGGSGWLTRRGHFRPIAPNDPIAVGLQCSMWPTEVFRSLWLDEAIRYGYEDAELSLRLHESRPVPVLQSPHEFINRGAGRTAGLDRAGVAREMEVSRMYVGIKRYATSRWRLAAFLGLEAAASTVRRRSFPDVTVPNQWSASLRYVLGGPRPDWTRPTPPGSVPAGTLE